MQRIIEAFETLIENEGEEYAATLIGPRTRGSLTGEGVILGTVNDYYINPCLIHDTLVLRPFEHPALAEGCTAYQLDLNPHPMSQMYHTAMERMNPRVGAREYGKLSTLGKSRVKEREGHAGPELWLDSESPNHDPTWPTSKLTFIIGPDGSLWTWHPGDPLEPYNKEEGIKPGTAVKLS